MKLAHKKFDVRVWFSQVPGEERARGQTVKRVSNTGVICSIKKICCGKHSFCCQCSFFCMFAKYAEEISWYLAQLQVSAYFYVHLSRHICFLHCCLPTIWHYLFYLAHPLMCPKCLVKDQSLRNFAPVPRQCHPGFEYM
jgi:hypothetical protein